MKILIILNREPYDGTDVTWNSLRLAGKLIEGGLAPLGGTLALIRFRFNIVQRTYSF